MDPRKILVVDDEPEFRDVLAANLGRLGYAVTLAADGREASVAIAASHFDLVITDLLMPDKEGLELIQELRRDNGSTRIIAMSGGGRNASTSYLDLARRFGAHAMLTKPFTSTELVSAIDAALSLRWLKPASG